MQMYPAVSGGTCPFSHFPLRSRIGIQQMGWGTNGGAAEAEK